MRKIALLLVLFALSTPTWSASTDSAKGQDQEGEKPASWRTDLDASLEYIKNVLKTREFESGRLTNAVAVCEAYTRHEATGLVFAQGVYLPDYPSLKDDYSAWKSDVKEGRVGSNNPSKTLPPALPHFVSIEVQPWMWMDLSTEAFLRGIEEDTGEAEYQDLKRRLEALLGIDPMPLIPMVRPQKKQPGQG
jgi:hypothetical protein